MTSDGTLVELSARITQGDIGCREVAERCLARIEQGSHLNAFISIDAERVLARAAALDAMPEADRGPLHGLPIAVKDIFCQAGVETTAGSRMLQGWRAPYDAHVIQRLEAAGALLVGKTNMDEFAMGSSGENSHYGPTRNPWNTERVPGGSSSGSAAAVASGMVPAALGTDTGGSIRQPAAFCGLTGLKPTYGRVSRWGMIAFASSLDQAGPMAWTAADLALLLAAMAGCDERDSTSVDRPVDAYSAALEAPIEGRRIGIPDALLGEDVAAPVRAAVDAAKRTFEQLGATTHAVSLPTALAGVPAYYVLAPAEASTNLARYDGVRFGHRCSSPQSLEDLYLRSRAEGFGSEVKRRILTGTYVLSVGYYEAYYLHAQRVRRLIRDEFLAAFEDVDAILAPTTPGVAFALGEKTDDPVAMYQQDVFTIPANLAGIPALSMPAGLSAGMPLGVQLLGPHFAETTLLNLAHAFQTATDHHLARPAGAAA